MKILLTGIAGFIGFHLAKKLLANGHEIIGLDNINDYYDSELKLSRLEALGISKVDALNFHTPCKSKGDDGRLSFVRVNLEDREPMSEIFEKEKFDIVCHLAAQAGVRYSLKNPHAYVDSNLIGFLNILEGCRHNKVKHLVYASSSSVYGLNDDIPFTVEQNVDRPISLYAATKKSNELMAHTYSHLFGFATTGLRFFTVYGPWGRPDMAMFLFTDAILRNNPIKVFNHGNMERDFTYVDDIVQGVERIVERSEISTKNNKRYALYNIGNNSSIKLMDFIAEIETNLDKKAKIEMMPLQAGDVEKTWANVDNLISDYDYNPSTPISEGVKKYVKWHRKYYSS